MSIRAASSRGRIRAWKKSARPISGAKRAGQVDKLKVIFAGTPAFARVALERLHAAGFDIALVLTQPDRPAGRGMKLQPSAVKEFALLHGMPLAQPRSLRLDGKYPDDALAAQQSINAVQADAMVVAAYGLILPQWVLDAPRLGCMNIHASLLPRWRGAAPIHRAIEAGDSETGITIMQMDAGLDTGDMLLVERVPVAGDDTTGSLHDKLAPLGGQLVVRALTLAAQGGLTRTPQPARGVTYAQKIDKAEAAIDWSQSAATIASRVRAFNPAPGATAALRGESIKVWRANALRGGSHGDGAGSDAPGTVIAVDDRGIVVACGEASLLHITELQRAGGKRLAAADFVRGVAIAPGAHFD